MMNTRRIWLGVLSGALVMANAVAGAATVTATLDPPQVALGESAQLTVTVSGSQEQPAVPKIDGLEIISVGQSTQIEIINGSITANASNTYSITPQHEGTFTIPAIHAGNAVSQPLTLRVGAGAPAPAAPSGGMALPQPSGQGPVVMPPSQPAPATASVPAGKYGTIQVMVPKTEFYEGELVPVQVRVIVPEEVQASYSETPQAESGGFTVDPLLSKPAQTEEMIDGRPCAVLAWTTALRALKPGTYTVDLTMPLTVITPPQMPQMGDDDSINNFFRNAFAAVGGTRKDVQLSSKTDPLKILPLPQAGRPASFQGAVGRFDVEAGAAPTQVTAGDPITLTLKVSGRGNFDRVNSDMLAGSANWKTYSPKSHFDASDSLGYQGVKTFEQPVIANSASVTQVPSLEFSYFDPETRQYVTRTTSPVPLNVSGALAPTAPVNAPASAPLAASAPPPAPAPSGPDLRMNRVEPGAFVATLRPVYLSPLFLAGQALPLLALLGGLAFLRRRQRMAHPERVRLTAVQQAIRREVEGMEAAMRDHQAAPFFVHGRNALQQHFGPQWNVRPEAITVHDLDARLGAGAENLRTVFELADQASYSDLHLGDADLQAWSQVVLDALKETKR